MNDTTTIQWGMQPGSYQEGVGWFALFTLHRRPDETITVRVLDPNTRELMPARRVPGRREIRRGFLTWGAARAWCEQVDAKGARRAS